MADPITLTAAAIATLAFTNVKSAAGETGKKITEATLKKMGDLRQAIAQRFKSNPKAESAIVATINQLSPHASYF